VPGSVDVATLYVHPAVGERCWRRSPRRAFPSSG
jgi:hypothetical protein